jgi:hypothetical protein
MQQIFENLSQLSFMYRNIVWVLEDGNKVVVTRTATELIEAYTSVLKAINETLKEHLEHVEKYGHDKTENIGISIIRDETDERRLKYKTMNNVAKLCVAKMGTCTTVQQHVYYGIHHDINNAVYYKNKA